MLVEDLRKEFPLLDRKVYGKDLVYFDNAATAQRPRSVLSLWNSIETCSNANIHRAVHRLASEATDAYENAREFVRNYLNASERSEIVFTSGATASVNLVASSFCRHYLKEGDEILVSEAEHHSNIVPWQIAAGERKASVRPVPVDDRGEIVLSELKKMISGRTKLVSVAHISNVLGIINPVEEITDICHAYNVPVLIDGAQGIVHEKVDVRKLDCDFYVFSGHKVFAAPGTGVLYGKRKYLDEMPPFMGGGEMVGNVSFDGTTYAPIPLKFEAGTQNFASVPTLVPALELAGSILSDVDLRNNESRVKEWLYDSLSSIDGLRILGTPDHIGRKIPLFSFVIEGVHHEDLALILDKTGIAVRSGQMCAEPLMKRFGVTGVLRASLAAYNTMDEAEYFVTSLKRAAAMLK